MTLIDAAERLRSEIDDLVVLALSATYPISTSVEYEAYVREQLAQRRLDDTVLLVSDFLAAEVARTTLLASDVIVLPYEETRGVGQRGHAVRPFAGASRRRHGPSDLRPDAVGAYYRVPAGDPDVLAEAIGRFVTDGSLRNRWGQRRRSTGVRRVGSE